MTSDSQLLGNDESTYNSPFLARQYNFCESDLTPCQTGTESTASIFSNRWGQRSLYTDGDCTRACWYVRDGGRTTRPTNPQLRGRFRHSQNLDGTVLRPIAGASMDFACRP